MRLDRYIQGRHGLVGDDESRLQRDGPGDTDALSLAAAESMWEAVHVLGTQANDAQQLSYARLEVPAAHVAVHYQRLADDLQERHAWVQRPVGVLEHLLHIEPYVAQGRGVGVDDVDRAPARVVEDHLARGRFDSPEYAVPGRGLSATALADQAQRLALEHFEAHAVYRLHLSNGASEQPACDGVILLQVPNLENWFPG